VAGGLAVIVLALAVVAADTVIGAPGAAEIRTLRQMPRATVVLDRHDEPAFTIFEERRYEVPLEWISPNVIQAVVAIEDQRFYRHRGLDLWRIAGSMWANVRNAGWEQGGSTITQQLARQSFLTPDKNVRRKLKEAYLALRIERQYSKAEILGMYLNKVYFGAGLYGVEAAARGYFGKPAADLSVAEGALLAGVIQRPSAYSPDTNLERAVARRAVVLDQMAAAGMIDRDVARELAGTAVTLTDGFEHEMAGAYFKQAVTRELVDRFGWELVSIGGLRVFSTLDSAAQRAAENAVAEQLSAIEQRRAFPHPARGEVSIEDGGAPEYLQGALVALDPSSGAVLALVGGRDFADSQFDRVMQARRQSGSAFKPFVYAAALEQGYSPATMVTGLDRPIPTPEGPWLPDEGHEHPEALTVRTALRTSSNRAAAQVLQAVGVPQAVQYANRLGLEAPPVPSLVLGTGDVTLLALTTAYATFANGGLMPKPFLIRRVEDASGRVLMETRPEASRVVSEQTAYQISAMLADVVDRGTGYGARQVGFRKPAAGKTGTTNEYRDAWFVGYTPDLVAGVWVGFDRPRTIVPGGYASELAVPIWGAFMRDATAGSEGKWFDRPGGIVAVNICQESGLLPGSACRRVPRVSSDGESRTVSTVAVEYFQPGTVPTETCPLHESSWFGGVQTAAFDPSEFPSRSTVGVAARTRPSVDGGDKGESDGQPAVAVRTESSAQVEERNGGQDSERRGFWSRFVGVFRGGGDSDDDEQEETQDDSERPRPRGRGGAR
jgi:penicillin-binding protein 1A